MKIVNNKEQGLRKHKHCESNCPQHNTFANSLRRYPSSKDLTTTLASQRRSTNQKIMRYNSSAKYIKPFKTYEESPSTYNNNPHQRLLSNFSNVKLVSKGREKLRGSQREIENVMINAKTNQKLGQVGNGDCIIAEKDKYDQLRSNVERLTSAIDKVSQDIMRREKKLGIGNFDTEGRSQLKGVDQNLSNRTPISQSRGKLHQQSSKSGVHNQSSIQHVRSIDQSPGNNHSRRKQGFNNSSFKTSSKGYNSSSKSSVIWKHSDIFNYSMKKSEK